MTRNAATFGLILLLACAAAAQDTLWAWKAPVPWLDATPAVADFTGDGALEIATPGSTGDVTLLDRAGRVCWRVMLEGPLSMAPTAADVTGGPGAELLVLNNHGVLHCLDGASGDVVWQRALPAGVTWGMSCAAACDLDGDGRLEVIACDDGGNVVCFGGDGGQRWRYAGAQGATMCPSAGTLGDGPEVKVVVAGASGGVVCLGGDGAPLWEHRGDGPASSPILADIDGDGGNEVLVVLRRDLVALDEAGGVLWRAPLKREVDSALTAADLDQDGRAEILAADLSGELACIAGDGAVRWTLDVEERVRRSPTVADIDGDGALEVLVAGYSGALHVVTPDGYVRQRVSQAGVSNASAVVATLADDGAPVVLYTVCTGQLTALRWPQARPGAAVAWADYRGGAARAGTSTVAEVGDAVRMAAFQPGRGHVGGNTLRVVVENPGEEMLAVDLEVSANGAPLARERVESAEDAFTAEVAYVLGGSAAVNLRVEARVRAGDRVVVQRSRSLYVVPFRQELTDAEDLLDRLDRAVAGLPDPRGIQERACFLRVQLPDLEGRVDRAGTLSDADRRALRDAFAGYLTELDRLEGLARRAAAHATPGATLLLSGANPWAPFGGVDELLEDRVTEAGLAVEAFHGEREAAALNLFNLSGAAVHVRVEAGPLTREGGGEVPARDVLRMHEVVPVPSQMLDLAPDAVPLLNQGHVLLTPAWDGRQLFLDLDTRGLAPGRWRGELRLRTLEVTPQDQIVPLEVTVWETALPEQQALRLCHWGYVHRSCLQDQPRAALQDQLELGTNVFVGLFAPQASFDAEGNLTGPIDYADHDAYVRQHAPHGIILFCGYQGNLRGPAAPGEPAYNRAHVAWLRAWVAHLKDLGVGYDGFALYPVDEPGLSKGLVETYIQFAELAREADPKIQMYTDPVGRITLEELDRMAPLVDIWCPGRGGLLLRDFEKLDFIRATGRTVWTYECDGNAKHQDPLGYYRAQAWLAWHYGLTGIGFWSYCTSGDDPWFPPAGGQEYLLIYPGEGVVRSKRWFAIRDGIEDYAMLALLRERLAATADGTTVERMGRLLGEDASAIGRFCGLDEGGTTPGRHGLSAVRALADERQAAFQAVRRDLAALLALP